MWTIQEYQEDTFYLVIKIFHVIDIENLMETDNLKEYINNSSFKSN